MSLYKFIYWMVVVFGILFEGCATSRDYSFGVAQFDSIDKIKFETKLRGHVKVEYAVHGPALSCQESPQFDLYRGGSKYGSGVTKCAADQKKYIASFANELTPGKYSLERSHRLTKLKGDYESEVFFQPVDAEADSGPDQTYQGAAALQEGANTGHIDPNLGDKTDWWKIELSELKKFSFVYSSNQPAQECQVSLYKLSSGQLVLKRKFDLKSATPLYLEGIFYIQARGRTFGRPVDYSLSLSALEKRVSADKAPTEGSELFKKMNNIPIVDRFQISKEKTAIILGIGLDHGIQPKDTLKISSIPDGKLVGTCEVVGTVAPQESECHLLGIIPQGMNLRAQGGF